MQLAFDGINDKEINYILDQLHQIMDPLDPNRYRKKPYNLRKTNGERVWDGRVKIMDRKHRTVPTGLYPELYNFLIKLKDLKGYDFKFVDNRGPKLTTKIPNSITLDGHGEEKTITLRDYQYQSVANALREQNGILLEATNAGKCLEKSTKLLTNYGILTIEEILKMNNVDIKDTTPRAVKPVSDIKVVNGYGKLECPALLTINGLKNVLRINTDIGSQITITSNNPVLTVNDGYYKWKRADKLKENDLIVSRLNSNTYGNNQKFNKFDAYCLGLLIADGCYHGHSFNFTNNEPTLINLISKWFKELTKHDPRKRDRYIKGSYSSTCVYLKTGRIPYDKFRNKLEIGNSLAGGKILPSSIMKSPKEIQLAFLSGFFECEMSFDLRRCNIELTGKSQALILDIQQMLFNMGIYSRIHIKKVKGYKDPYYVILFDTSNSGKLINLLTFETPNRIKQSQVLKNNLSLRKRNRKGYSVPGGKQLMYAYYKTLPLDIRRKVRRNGQIPKTISQQRVNKILDKAPMGDRKLYKQLRSLASPEIAFARITSIEDRGIVPTYDLEMPETHTLVANGLVVHNTSIAISLYKYLLPTLEERQRLLFIAPNSSIMNQVYLKFQHYIGEQYVGIWGDGKKDLTPPIICATIQTIASAIKEPETKLTRKNDKLVERLATRYAPAVLEKGSPRANLRLLALNFKPKYKYEQDDLELLRSLTMSLQTDDDVRGCMEAYQKKYKKLLYKLNKKGYEKYYEAIDTLKSVRGVVCDEAHSAGAISYWNVFQYMTNARLRIGMTGTLDKSKKIHMQRIKAILGNPIISVTNKQMIDRGVSAKPHIRMVPIDQPTNLEQQIGAIAQKKGIVGGSTSDLMMYQLAYQLGVVQNSYRNSIIAQLANATAKQLDKQAVLIIVNSIEHGENICKELDKLDADYLFIQGKDDTETREKALAKVRNGELKILIGTKIIDTGIDIPNFKALILCSSGKSYMSLLQRIGRLLRIMPDKREVIIFDVLDETSEILYKHGKQRIRYYKEQGFDVK